MKLYIHKTSDQISVVWDDGRTWVALDARGTCVGSVWAKDWDWDMEDEDIFVNEADAKKIMDDGGKLLTQGDLTPDQMSELERLFDSLFFCPVCNEWDDAWEWVDKTWKCSECGTTLRDEYTRWNNQYTEKKTVVVK